MSVQWIKGSFVSWRSLDKAKIKAIIKYDDYIMILPMSMDTLCQSYQTASQPDFAFLPLLLRPNLPTSQEA
jgi:hypothetical protein